MKKFTEKEIISDISEYIVNNDLAYDFPVASTDKLAMKYGVCPMTVNRAMDKLVKKGLLYRIRGKGTFVAKKKADGKTYNIGIFLWPGQRPGFDDTNEAAYGTFSDYLVREIHSLGHRATLFYSFLFCDPSPKKFNINSYDALIIAAGMVNEDNFQILSKYKRPIIMIQDDKVSDYFFDQVIFDYSPGFLKALEYLKTKGHSKIIVLGSVGTTSNGRRHTLSRMADSIGVEVIPIIGDESKSIHNELMILLGRSLGKKYLEKRVANAVFALSDLIAFGFIDVLKENNISLGHDIDLISYDNLEGRGLLPFGEPIITCVEHPLVESAKQVLKLLFSSLKEYENVTRIIRVPADKFIIRQTA